MSCLTVSGNSLDHSCSQVYKDAFEEPSPASQQVVAGKEEEILINVLSQQSQRRKTFVTIVFSVC